MVSPLKDFLRDGVVPTVTQVFKAKPFKASMAGFGSFFVPGTESLTLFRVIAHESAHGIEAKIAGATVEGIEIEYKPFIISGATTLDDTTEESALRSALAGIGCDIGFIACSTLVLRKLSPSTAALFLAYDLVSFFMSTDYATYRLAKERIQVKSYE